MSSDDDANTGGEVTVGDLALPVISVTTRVATIMLPSGVETAMLLDVYYHATRDGNEKRATFLISTAGVPVVKAAIAEYEQNLRKYLAGELEPVVIQAERSV